MQRSKIASHILLTELPKDQQFTQLATPAKYFLDTIKMIAYRAETAMANVAREVMSRMDDARSLLRSIYQLEADLVADEKNNILWLSCIIQQIQFQRKQLHIYVMR